MLDNDDSVTRKLLESPTSKNMNSAVIENEKGGALVKSGVEPDLRLHDAVCDPDEIEEIKSLIEEESHLLFERDKDGRCPIHTVAIDGINKSNLSLPKCTNSSGFL